jgi:hypothetical protein
MQLKKRQSLSELLAIATGALLTQAPENALAIAEDLDMDLSYMEYREDDRVRVREMDVGVKWFYDDDNVFTGKVITDSITGATPSGALKPPAAASQTLTTPSGVAGASGVGGASGNYLEPLTEFVDRRVAISAGWEHTFQRRYRGSIGAIFSNEDDYQSYGGNIGAAIEFNNKLTTLEGGLGASYDLVTAGGGIQEELGNVIYDKEDAYEDGEKLTVDYGISVTQILTRGSLVKVGISQGNVSGYLSDPYKVVTLIDEVTDEPEKYFHEKRPNDRTRSAIFADYNRLREFDDVVSIGYRYFWDDWGIRAHTLDMRYRHDLRGTHYITGHVRLYKQSEADFYRAYLDEANNEDPELDTTAPEYASADQRLDALTSYTLGVKYGMTGSLGDFFIRYEVMRQIGTHGDYRQLTAQLFQVVWTLDFIKQ